MWYPSQHLHEPFLALRFFCNKALYTNRPYFFTLPPACFKGWDPAKAKEGRDMKEEREGDREDGHPHFLKRDASSIWARRRVLEKAPLTSLGALRRGPGKCIISYRLIQPSQQCRRDKLT